MFDALWGLWTDRILFSGHSFLWVSKISTNHHVLCFICILSKHNIFVPWSMFPVLVNEQIWFISSLTWPHNFSGWLFISDFWNLCSWPCYSWICSTFYKHLVSIQIALISGNDEHDYLQKSNLKLPFLVGFTHRLPRHCCSDSANWREIEMGSDAGLETSMLERVLQQFRPPPSNDNII